MEKILKEFAALNLIPRKSKHEKAVAEYLAKRGEALGYRSFRDAANNVIIEVPATPGCETAPFGIVQAHSDMVCVSEDPAYDPLTSPIVTVNDGKTLRAQNSSLGADDGIGVAMILALLDSDAPHGPLRVIFTADEESGMSGALGLAEQYTQGDYLINIDWEEEGSVCVSCAGSLTVIYKKQCELHPMEGAGYEITLRGLRGGHSGVEIVEHRPNAIAIVGRFLYQLIHEKIGFSLVAIQGGRAHNVICPDATVKLVVEVSQKEQFAQCFQNAVTDFEQEFADTEKDFYFLCKEMKEYTQGFSIEDSANIASFLGQCPQGVASMSQEIEGLVELSDNLGVISTDENGVTLEVLYRASESKAMHGLAKRTAELAADCGWVSIVDSENPSWPPKLPSPILDIAKEVYFRQSGREIRVELIHAGLECGYFAEKNPGLDIISLGPTITDAHSVRETLHVDTLKPTMDLFLGILGALISQN